ncbi:MAG: GLPGLI family protein [Winogradskyella sp.]|uniref:GLPGLI family protein n=1 Tax=Winogradskyella sp. TaxID=1883156 RepID=UPI0017D97841|nr:GLPGLI family protein [Winogradskyella sp.]MBT8244371.1 GLPGLI family protein [Winogradskyella sp.]NNK22504.1 GLPGLI family protein [Winogradskyella sp.]
MKNIFFYLIISIFSLGFSQDKVVTYEYEVNYNLGRPLYKTGYLLSLDDNVRYNTTKTIFLKDFKKYDIDSETGNPQISFLGAGNGSENVVYLGINDSIISTKSLGREVLLIKEKIPIQIWELTGIKKLINGYQCVELKTQFRGRKYKAYVDLSIPFRYGPWKFNSLPGLAIKIIEEENKLIWTLKAVSKRDLDVVEDFIFKQNDYLSSLREVSLKEYVELYDNTKGGSDVLFSKLPREYKKDKSSTSQFKRGGFELKYEWEEN